ncbi:hypothetical protein GCM10023093_04620 [Nemorincola caseinilytica]|uniref:DUF3098 domain-containing protein n=1 Tax=Nemorincola caseinilytica TaxID=2054315 RepID=A0ABP8N411_9BACT
MSTPLKTNAPAPRPAPPASAASAAKTENRRPAQPFLFDKENYKWMLIGLAVIFLSFILMAGGKAANPNEFHYEELYSFRRITLAPILLLVGFGIEAYAIMKKPKEQQ